MSKIKLTKGELKRQKDSLKRFQHYLPTLLLKKQQLQTRILEARQILAEKMGVLGEIMDSIDSWVNVLGDARVDLNAWVTPVSVEIEKVNIAGASVPVYRDIHFKPAEYDFYTTPFWVDKGIEKIRLLMTFLVEVDIIKKRVAILEKELRTTSQRVNLFEKIKIPESQDNIKRISIYLGDQQANAVGVSKVAKKKIIERTLVGAAR